MDSWVVLVGSKTLLTIACACQVSFIYLVGGGPLVLALRRKEDGEAPLSQSLRRGGETGVGEGREGVTLVGGKGEGKDGGGKGKGVEEEDAGAGTVGAGEDGGREEAEVMSAGAVGSATGTDDGEGWEEV